MRRLAAQLWCLGALALASCGSEDGIVEVYWEFNDVQLRRIYPVGTEPDTCDLPSQSGTAYNLRVRLTVAETSEACAEDWTGPDCAIIKQRTFPCNRSRGTALDVPVSADESGEDPGYLMIVEAVVDIDSEQFVPLPSCVSQAGPRVRRVRPGRITDLEIYPFTVFAIDLDGQDLDIEACRP